MIRHVRWEFPSRVMVCTHTALGKCLPLPVKYTGQGWSVQCPRQTRPQPTKAAGFPGRKQTPLPPGDGFLHNKSGRLLLLLVPSLVSAVCLAVETAAPLG